jgi:hypothetical protein
VNAADVPTAHVGTATRVAAATTMTAATGTSRCSPDRQPCCGQHGTKSNKMTE